MPNVESKILVIPSGIGSAGPKGAKGLLDSSPQPISLGTTRLKENLKTFMDSISEVLSGVPKATGGFTLDEIEVTVEVNGEGSLQLIGGMKVGASGGITLRLKR
jgi:hypothetical protein